MAEVRSMKYEIRIFFIEFFYLSVLNGDAGKPSLLYKLAPSGLSAHAYLTYMGLAILSLHTITLSLSIFAFAQTNFLSAPAIANSPGSSPSFVVSPLPILLNVRMILFCLLYTSDDA